LRRVKACRDGQEDPMEEKLSEDFAALIGIDWADCSHAVCMLDVKSNRIDSITVEQKPEALVDWVNQLRSRFSGRKIAIAIEQSKGPLIYFLMRYEFVVLYPVNPKALSRYRDALRCSGAKDDPTDAEMLLSFLRAHGGRLRAWVPEDEISRHLGMLVEFRRKLVGDARRITNRLGALLKGYYPQALECLADLKTLMACEFLTKWPSLSALKQAKPAQLRKLYRGRHHSTEFIEERIAAIRKSSHLTEDPAIVCGFSEDGASVGKAAAGAD
jgi:transposase